MGRVALIGETSRVAGFGLAGALVLPAEDAAAARDAWRSLPSDVAVVVLTPAAAAAIGAPTGPAATGATAPEAGATAPEAGAAAPDAVAGRAATGATPPDVPLTVVMPP